MTQKDEKKMTSAKLNQLCQEFEQQAVSSPAEWVSFLTVASNLSAYQPTDQLMVYGQRPTATAVTTYDYWMTKVKRAVKKNATGIAIFPPKSAPGRSIRYVFDVSDTRDGYYDAASGRYVRADNDRMFLPSIIRRQDEEMIIDVLQNNQNINITLPSGISLENAIREIARQRFDLEADRYIKTILRSTPQESALYSLEKDEQTELIRQILTDSAAYVIGHKVGVDSVLDGMEHAFDRIGVFSYNGAVTWLGTCLTYMCAPVQNAIRNHLRELEKEGRYDIKAAQDEKRSTSAVFSEVSNEYVDHGEDRISSGRGLPDPEHRADGESAGGSVRPEVAEIHGTEPRSTGDVPADAGDTGRDRSESTERDGRQSDAVGGRIPGEASGDTEDPGSDQESPSEGDGTRDGGRRDPSADSIQTAGGVITPEAVLPAEEQQTESIKKAVREETIPAAFLVSENEIDEILRTGSGYRDSRIQLLLGELIYIKDPATLASVLKDDYGIDETDVCSKGYLIDSGYISVLMDSDAVFFSKGMRSDEREVALSWEEIAGRILTLYKNKDFVKEEYATTAENVYLNEVANRIVLYFWNRRSDERYAMYKTLPVFQEPSYTPGGFPGEVDAVAQSLKGDGLSILREIFQRPNSPAEDMIRLHLDAIASGAQPIVQDNSHDPMTESFIPEDEVIRRALRYAVPSDMETRFAMQSFFEDGKNGADKKVTYLKNRCNNSGSGSMAVQINGTAKGLSITQNGITQAITYKDIAAHIDTQIEMGVFLPEDRKQEYLTYKENLEKAGITYTVRSEDEDSQVFEGVNLEDMIRLMKEDPSRSADAQIRGKNGITISYSMIRGGILCPEELYRALQIQKIGYAEETDERRSERDYALIRQVMRAHIPHIVEELPAMHIIPTTASTFQKSVSVNIITSDNAAFHEGGWSISRPDAEDIIPSGLNFDVFARYIDEISRRYSSADMEVYPTYVTFDIVAGSEPFQETLVKEGSYRHTVYFTKGMERINIRSLIADNTPSVDERYLLSEEYETPSIKTLRDRSGSEQIFRLSAGSVSPVMLKADESMIQKIILGAENVFSDDKPLYLVIDQPNDPSHPETMFKWGIAAYHGVREIMDRVTINRLNDDLVAGDNYYLKDAVTTFLKEQLNLEPAPIVEALRPVEEGAFSQMQEIFGSTGEEVLAPVNDAIRLYVPFEGSEDLYKDGSIQYDASGIEFSWKIAYDISYGARVGHYEHSQSGLLSYGQLLPLLGLAETNREEVRDLQQDSDHLLPDVFERGDVFLFHGEPYVVYTASGNRASGTFYAVLEGEPRSEDSLYAIHYSGDYRQFLSSDGSFENAHRKNFSMDEPYDEKAVLRPEEGDIVRTPGGTFLVEKVYPGDIFSLKNTDPEADRQRVTYMGSIPSPYQTMSRKSWPVYSEKNEIVRLENTVDTEKFPFEEAALGESFTYDNSTYTLLAEDPESGKKTFRVEHTENSIKEGDRFEWNGALYEVFKTTPSQPYLTNAPRGICAYNLCKDPDQFAIELYGSFENILKEDGYTFHPFSRTITIKEGSQQSYRSQLSKAEAHESRLYMLKHLSYDYQRLETASTPQELRQVMDLIHEGDRILVEGKEKTVIRKTRNVLHVKETPENRQEEEQMLLSLPETFAIMNRSGFQHRSIYEQVKETLTHLQDTKESRLLAGTSFGRDFMWIDSDISDITVLLAAYSNENIPSFTADPEVIEEGRASTTPPAIEPASEISGAPQNASETDTFLFDGIEAGSIFTFRDRIFRFEKETADGAKQYSYWNTIHTAKSGDRFTYRGAVYEIMDRSGENGAWAQSGISWIGKIPSGLQAINITDPADEFGLEIYGDYISTLLSAEDFTFLPMERTAIYHAPLTQLPEEGGMLINETIGSSRPLSHLAVYDYHYLKNDASHQSLFTDAGDSIFERSDGRDYYMPSGLVSSIEEGDIIRFNATGRLGNGEMTYLIRKKRGSVLFGSAIAMPGGAVSQSIQSIHPLPETIEIVHRQSWPKDGVLKQVAEELAKVERKIYTLQSGQAATVDNTVLQRLTDNAQKLRRLYDSYANAASIQHREVTPDAAEFKDTPHAEDIENGIETIDINPTSRRPFRGSSSGNYHIPGNEITEAPPQVRARRNIEAIRTLKRIEGENRYATEQEQKILARYVGWGGLSVCFEDNNELRAETEELRQILTSEEYESARESTLTAFYTPPEVIRAIYGTLSRMGFKDGNILEPAMGTGSFFGMLPQEMATSRLRGVELDSISGRIARLLYPDSSITIGAFENTDLPDNYYDVAIGNVPFGSFSVADRRYDRYHFPIHEYFFAKTLDKVRPGGVIALVCSRYLLDKKDSHTRRYLAQRADLLGAVRLPEETFMRSSGTDTICDILFLKKRDSFSEEEPLWVYAKSPDGAIDEIRYNAYFQEHPEMAIGDYEAKVGQWGFRPSWKLGERDLSKELSDSLSHIKGSIEPNEALIEEAADGDIPSVPADPEQLNFTYTEHNGEIYFKENGRMYRVNLQGKRQERIRGMIRIREAMLGLISAESAGSAYETVAHLRESLNTAYDDFVRSNGHLCEAGNRRAFMEDASYCLIASLEETNEHNEFLKKADMFSKRTIRPEIADEHADTAADALTMSLRKKGLVDMEYMSKISSIKEEDLAEELAGRIYKDPQSGQYLSADDYLSGNTRKKLQIAIEEAKKDPQFAANVTALEKVLPKWVSSADIEVHMGATWIDTSYYEQFMYEYLETNQDYRRGGRFAYASIQIGYDDTTATYTVEGKERGNGWSIASYAKGTTRANGYILMECSLNQKSVQIKDPERMDDGRIEYVLNFPATQAAQEKQHEMERAFEDWIFKDKDRRKDLEEKYNNTFNSITKRSYDGSFFDFPGMSPMIELMEHQKDAVARIVLNHTNTLLGHVVGAGKTFEMIAGCMERKRLGFSQKALFVVPNHLVEQWGRDFYRLYPGCHILVTGQNDFQKNNRKRLFSRIATGDYDAIIIAHSQLVKLPLSKEKEAQYIKDEISSLGDSIKKCGTRQVTTVKKLERQKKILETSLKRLINAESKDDVIPFDFLGIDALYVDEAHLFKNLGFETKKNRIAGVTNTPSQRATDLYLKTRYINEVSGGNGIVFATGTPVSNSMSELYTLMRYLQSPLLKELGLSSFDAWAAQFGLTIMSLELNTLGTGCRSKERFARFFNLPELLGMFQMSCDIKTREELALPGPKAQYHTEETQKSVFQSHIMQELEMRSDAIHAKTVDPRDDNMLKVTMDGRRVALDQRIYNPDLPESEGCKARKCAENILKLYHETQNEKGAQLVFCDQSVPNGRVPFNVYDELKKLLTEGGMKEDEIEYIQDASSDAKKKALFAKVRSGEVRVLIGSTEKMGAGMNVQDRLIALHHLDIPWRPSDIEQREGRILRQGNMYDEVHIFRYITKDTFDAYSWQIIESKARFISQIMNTKNVSRSAEDIDENVLSYAEVKALCTGNEDIRRQIILTGEVARLKIARSAYQKEQNLMEDNITRIYPGKIKDLSETIALNKKDLALYEKHKDAAFVFHFYDKDIQVKKEAGKKIREILRNNRQAEAIVPIGTYLGFEISGLYAPVQSEAHYSSYMLIAKANATHRYPAIGNGEHLIESLDESLSGIANQIELIEKTKEKIEKNLEEEKRLFGVPWKKEEEYQEKVKELEELNARLNLSNPDRSQTAYEILDDMVPCCRDEENALETKNIPEAQTEKPANEYGTISESTKDETPGLSSDIPDPFQILKERGKKFLRQGDIIYFQRTRYLVETITDSGLMLKRFSNPGDFDYKPSSSEIISLNYNWVNNDQLKAALVIGQDFRADDTKEEAFRKFLNTYTKKTTRDIMNAVKHPNLNLPIPNISGCRR